MTAATGLDEALKLETVYYSAPVPRDLPNADSPRDSVRQGVFPRRLSSDKRL
jgi:hypothetical protein